MTGVSIVEYILEKLQDQELSATKYESLAEALRQAMKDKILLPGANLPGERKLATSLGVSRITVRNAIDKLAVEGLLDRRQGARTSVTEKVGKHISNLVGFSEDLISRGYEPGMRLLSAKIVTGTDLECEKLELDTGSEVVRLRRVRLANERPIALEVAVLPASIVRSVDDIGRSLYASLEEIGRMPMRGIQQISAETADEDMARIIGTEPGAPMFVVRRYCRAADDVAVEYTTTYYNAQVFTLETELQR